ncbi:phosphate transporter PHO1 homolog 9 [Salvia miltiorrhiza]|uniref:phosphate transporter PHO1 homolog 9 n=1 Tax=Salvia miltiorrhiza TaxID=226208 RepID=UPI0025AD8E8D|nr:phosphate transporter PHO1 homolog 9 [Salvia miltiorrhiza]
MKFGKELASQMVQEWQTAYMDYHGLKTLLKNLIIFRQQNASPPPPEVSRSRSLKRRLTMYRAFSGLNNLRGSPKKGDDEAILVSSVQEEGSDHSYYQTMFLRSSEEGGQIELEFFRKLDHEFNKVEKFYKDKVDQVKAEAEELTKQMDALIALRIRVDKPRVEQRVAAQFSAAAPATVVASVNGLKQGGVQLDAIQEVEMSSEGDGGEEARAKRNRNFRPASLEVLDHVKINVEPDTPVSTLRNMIGNSKSDLSFSKVELSRAEEKLRQAFTEFYQQLRLLKSYCFLNMLAFSKIMKKYDKITSRSASKAYLEMVDNSYLGTSDEVNKLIERLEATFIKYFANGNRRKGMKSLKPGQKREKHRTTFFIGLFTGCSIALVVAIIVSLHGRALLEPEERTKYMESIFPLYSLFGFIVLHMLMYGTDTYFWRRYRVNYPFIFGFKPGTELGFREVFLLASGLSVLSLAAVLSNLDLEMDPDTLEYRTLTELVPLALVCVVFVITICPFNIVYRSSRYFLLHCAWRCVCAPLYKVTLPDFFLADQLTSQVQGFRSLLFYVYYYFLGDFTTRSNKFLETSNAYDILYIVVAIIPFWSRVIQCLRRLIEEKDPSQGVNSFKYFSTIVALVMRTIYSQKERDKSQNLMFWKIMAASTSGFTTIFNTYWDIVIDWGLLQRNSRNPWLRDKLLISNKAVYFVAIVVNILLRLVWMQLVLNFQVPFLHKKAMIALIACLEILRRGIWNFFRVENEHFNNVGKYRAFKTVPLPFHYEDEKIM